MQFITFSLVLMLNAIVAVVFGLAFLLAPGSVLGFFRTEAFVATVLIARFFGTAMLALGLVLWFAKNVTDPGVRKGIAAALLASAAAGLVVTIMGTFASNAVIRSNGWIVMLIYILFGLAYAYLVFGRQETGSQT